MRRRRNKVPMTSRQAFDLPETFQQGIREREEADRTLNKWASLRWNLWSFSFSLDFFWTWETQIVKINYSSQTFLRVHRGCLYLPSLRKWGWCTKWYNILPFWRKITKFKCVFNIYISCYCCGFTVKRVSLWKWSDHQTSTPVTSLLPFFRCFLKHFLVYFSLSKRNGEKLFIVKDFIYQGQIISTLWSGRKKKI